MYFDMIEFSPIYRSTHSNLFVCSGWDGGCNNILGISTKYVFPTWLKWHLFAHDPPWVDTVTKDCNHFLLEVLSIFHYALVFRFQINSINWNVRKYFLFFASLFWRYRTHQPLHFSVTCRRWHTHGFLTTSDEMSRLQCAVKLSIRSVSIRYPHALHILTQMILLKVLGAYPTSVSMVGGCPWWHCWLFSQSF